MRKQASEWSAFEREAGAALPSAPGELPEHPLFWRTHVYHYQSVFGEDARRVRSVLLFGGRGSGKEFYAAQYAREAGLALPYTARVNVVGLDGTAARSLLFGHEKGSYTGAVAARKGLFEAHQGEAVFVDELHHLPEAVQALLLRYLDCGAVEPLGGTARRLERPPVFIGAVHEDKQDKLLPDLRDRFERRWKVSGLREDPQWYLIPKLTALFLYERYRADEERVRAVRMAESMLLQICAARWEGNVRQLRAFVNTLQYWPEDEHGFAGSFVRGYWEHDDLAAGELLWGKTRRELLWGDEEDEKVLTLPQLWHYDLHRRLMKGFSCAADAHKKVDEDRAAKKAQDELNARARRAAEFIAAREQYLAELCRRPLPATLQEYRAVLKRFGTQEEAARVWYRCSREHLARHVAKLKRAKAEGTRG